MNFSFDTVRIGAYIQEPFASQCFIHYPHYCKHLGFELEYIYEIIVTILRMKVEWKMYENYKELFHALDNDKIDLIGVTNVAGLQSESIKILETPTTIHWGVGMFVKTTSISQNLNPFEYFLIDMWFCIIVISISIHFCNRFVPRRLRCALLSFKCATVFWYLIITFIMELYGNLMTSNLLLSERVGHVFDDLQGLGEKLLSKQCHFVISSQIVNDTDISGFYNPTHNKSWANIFRLAYKVNPPVEVNSEIEMFAFIQNSSCAVAVDYITPGINPADFFCNVEQKHFPDEMPLKPSVYYHRLRNLEKTFDVLFASDPIRGLLNLLLMKYKKIYTSINPKQCKNGTDQTLSMQKLSYCFIVLIGGWIISFMVNVFKNVGCIFCTRYQTNNFNIGVKFSICGRRKVYVIQKS